MVEAMRSPASGREQRTPGGGRLRRHPLGGSGPDTPDSAAERTRSWHQSSRLFAMAANGDDDKVRLGGMALANGVLVHGPSSWACAIRTGDGELQVASAY